MSTHFTPHFRLTPRIKKQLAAIDALQSVRITHVRAREKRLLEQLEEISSDKHEVVDYMKAYDQMMVWAKAKAPLTEERIKILHAYVLGNRKKSAYRRAQNAVFDETRKKIVYLPPKARYVPSLMHEFVNWIETSPYPPPITAAVCQIGLNTIHPFYDGNGRTARLLTKYILIKAGYKVPLLEEYYYKDINGYYAAIETKDTLTSWISYFCEGMISCYKKRKKS